MINPRAVALQGIGFAALLVAVQGFAPYASVERSVDIFRVIVENREYVVAFEPRAHGLDYEVRAYTIEFETRNYSRALETKTYVVPFDNRSYRAEFEDRAYTLKLALGYMVPFEDRENSKLEGREGVLGSESREYRVRI